MEVCIIVFASVLYSVVNYRCSESSLLFRWNEITYKVSSTSDFYNYCDYNSLFYADCINLDILINRNNLSSFHSNKPDNTENEMVNGFTSSIVSS